MREPKPVTRVELTDKNNTLRWIAAGLLLVIGVVGIAIGAVNYFNQDTGWQQVQITSQERNCSESFILRYNFSGTGAEASAVNRTLEAAYEEACVKAYQLFTPDESIDGVNNIYHINRHVNETVTVDPLLYDAFEKLDGTPYLCLGPLYDYYYGIIYNTDDAYLEEVDPAISAEARSYVAKIAEFAADENAVSLELLGNNQVKLHVSQDYLEFAQEEEIDTFIDFGYMTNAFIIDYLADTLISLDLTSGYLVSVDGYTRNLDSENNFSFSLYDRVQNLVNPAGVMNYRGPVSMVFLKDYPATASDANYRASEDQYVHLFADPADGMYRTSQENLVSYSYDMSCADVLLQTLPSFVGDSFTVPKDVYSVWFEDTTLCYNDPAITITDLMALEDVQYTAQLKN